MRNFILNIFCLFSLLGFMLSCTGHTHNDIPPVADSLCAKVAAERYVNTGLVDSLAVALSSVAGNDNELQMIACNARAYSALMAMDYAYAKELYDSVLDNSICEIERLVADVGLMTVSYRVSENRSFFDHRARAFEKIKRINDEVNFLTESDRIRFYRAKIEFGIVSICYFSNLAMLEEKALALEYLERNINEINDIPIRLYARMIIANNDSDQLSRMNSLIRGLGMAKDRGQTWLVANYKLLLAISLRGNPLLDKWNNDEPEKLDALAPRNVDVVDIPLYLAGSAIEDFRCAGDRYMMIEAMSVYASCQTQLGNYEAAIVMLESAMVEVNGYYSIYYPELDRLYSESLQGDSAYVIHHHDGENGVYFILECLLSIRREASCAYAGLGDTYNSLFNRDVYIGILNIIRDNKMLESRASMVETDLSRLKWLSLSVVSLLLVGVLFIFVYYRRRTRYDNEHSKELKRLPGVCRRLLAELPQEPANKDELCAHLAGILESAFVEIIPGLRFSVAAPMGLPEDDYPYVYKYTFNYVNSSDDDTLYVASPVMLSAEKQSLLAMVVPYVSVAVEEGLRLANINDEQLRVEEMHQAYRLYLAEHKRENLIKRVSVSIVMGMRPFMDRILNELHILPNASSQADSLRKLNYVEELTGKLDDLNVILERWIKMRQGDLNLQIEKFKLSELFNIVGKSAALMAMRDIDLVIEGGSAIVKADKALTLFMINTLVDNASKFTPAGGKITLSGNETDDYVEIAVEDTGIGISQADIERILNEKVYDASSIGADNEQLQAKSKGGGFGLMNCKGIIDKYRKTDSMFSVCSMDISSTKGKGSRFSFRLPKGVTRCIMLLLMLLPFSSNAAENPFVGVDSYVDSLVYCNVNGDYEGAYMCAERAVDLLNDHYKWAYPAGVDTLSLYSGSAAELRWWNEGLFKDSLCRKEVYMNIVDIRNEMSVAAMALLDWDTYRYNNYIYSTLVAKLKEEQGIAERYENAKALANFYNIVIALSCLLIFVLLVYYLISYVRHNIIGKTNERLMLALNRRLLAVASQGERRTESELLQGIVNEIYSSLSESMRIKRLSVLFAGDGTDRPVIVFAPESSLLQKKELYMNSVLNSGEQFISSDSLLRVLPLVVLNGTSRRVVGAIEIFTERPLSENESVAMELVAGYAASVAYHAAVRVASSYLALEEVEEAAERMKFEENRLHVQNMVMDNCLSVIKHETIYYPSRIKELARRAIADSGSRNESISSMRELMDYYSSIFGILSNCAKRELDDMSFTVSKIELETLFAAMQKYVERRSAKKKLDIKLTYEPVRAVVSVDADYMTFLFESLMDAALKVEKPGVLTLRATEAGDSVRVELIDPRRVITSEEAVELFTPSRYNIEDGNGVSGMEYLVAKEVVRLHEDYTGRRGSRMEARSDIAGTVILFTLSK